MDSFGRLCSGGRRLQILPGGLEEQPRGEKEPKELKAHPELAEGLSRTAGRALDGLEQMVERKKILCRHTRIFKGGREQPEKTEEADNYHPILSIIFSLQIPIYFVQGKLQTKLSTHFETRGSGKSG